MAHVVIDLDGTISSAPIECHTLCSSLIAAGHRVTVLTGAGDAMADQQLWDKKAGYLSSLGMAESYTDMTVVTGNVPEQKLAYCQNNQVDIAIDNSKENARAMTQCVPLVLVPWASRV